MSFLRLIRGSPGIWGQLGMQGTQSPAILLYEVQGAFWKDLLLGQVTYDYYLVLVTEGDVEFSIVLVIQIVLLSRHWGHLSKVNSKQKEKKEILEEYHSKCPWIINLSRMSTVWAQQPQQQFLRDPHWHQSLWHPGIRLERVTKGQRKT